MPRLRKSSRNGRRSRLVKRAVFARSKLFVTSPSDASDANGVSASRARSSSAVSNTDATGATSIDKDRTIFAALPTVVATPGSMAMADALAAPNVKAPSARPAERAIFQ